MLWGIDVIFPDQSTATLVVHDSGVPRSIEPSTPHLNTKVLTFIEGFSYEATPGTNETPDVPLSMLESTGVNVVGMAIVAYGAHMVYKSAAIVTAVRQVTEPTTTRATEETTDIAEWYQSVADGPQIRDNEPVVLTVRQAQEIAAIASAVLRGHEGFEEALALSSRFLQSSAFSALGIRASTSPNDVWAKVEDFPWPRSGEPNPQPDV